MNRFEHWLYYSKTAKRLGWIMLACLILASVLLNLLGMGLIDGDGFHASRLGLVLLLALVSVGAALFFEWLFDIGEVRSSKSKGSSSRAISEDDLT